MRYDTLYDEFLRCNPDDICKLQEIAEHVGVEPSDGMHIVFGMVVIPYLMELIEGDNDIKVKKVFDFFEKIAEVDDVMISEVLDFTVIEELISRGEYVLNKCKKYMGQKTLERCEIVGKYML